ncbi:MAG: DUF5106 domain-containing protein [Bacteroidales bacterium]|nr:DUF5106 domain-containing protein [Bacteroidales bacterium]
MSNKHIHSWLLWLAAVLVAVSSCTDKTQELKAYWNGYDFSSLDGFDDIREAEDKFDGYLDLLTSVSHNSAVENLRVFLDSAKRNDIAYMVWAGWFASAFHAMDSPYRSDELFKEWFAKVENDKVIDDEYMLDEFRQIRKMMDLNLIGGKPEDLNLINYNKDEFRLSDTFNGKTLVLFVDANCPSCLESLKENLKEYGRKKMNFVAVLVNGGRFHVENINRQLPEEVISEWNLVWCKDNELERGEKYDLSQVPFRMLVDDKGKIIKCYF